MSANCYQCKEYIQRDENIEACEMCFAEFCVSCMNGQYNCEECLEEERNEESSDE